MVYLIPDYRVTILDGYNENLTIDRINSDKDYTPDNCQWITSSLNTSFAHRQNIKVKHLNSLAEKTRILLVKRNNISESEHVRRLEITPQNLRNKLKRDNFSK